MRVGREAGLFLFCPVGNATAVNMDAPGKVPPVFPGCAMKAFTDPCRVRIFANGTADKYDDRRIQPDGESPDGKSAGVRIGR